MKPRRATRQLALIRIDGRHCAMWALGVLLGASVCATVDAAEPLQIDVITTASQHMTLGRLKRDPTVQVTVAEVDGIARMETTLSAQLPADLESAQREVHRRLATLHAAALPSLQRAATGIALASELGIDRAPAIVFDRTAVVYGEVDVEVALRRYRAWLAGSR